jgi:hypothetical protein
LRLRPVAWRELRRGGRWVQVASSSVRPRPVAWRELRRGGRWVQVVASSVRPRPVAWQELRRVAAARPCFRRAEARSLEQPLAVLSVWVQVPAAAWHQPVDAVAAQAMVLPSEMKAVGAAAVSE